MGRTKQNKQPQEPKQPIVYGIALETTGFPENPYSEIIKVSVVDLANNQMILDSLLSPKYGKFIDWGRKVTPYNGIMPNMLIGCSCLLDQPEVAAKFSNILLKASMLVTFSGPFVAGMLKKSQVYFPSIYDVQAAFKGIYLASENPQADLTKNVSMHAICSSLGVDQNYLTDTRGKARAAGECYKKLQAYLLQDSPLGDYVEDDSNGIVSDV